MPLPSRSSVAGRPGAVFNIPAGAPFSIFDCNDFDGTSTTARSGTQAGALPKSGSSTPSGDPNIFNCLTLPSDSQRRCSQSGCSVSQCQTAPACITRMHLYYRRSKYPGRNGFSGPGYWNANMNFYKNFSSTERFKCSSVASSTTSSTTTSTTHCLQSSMLRECDCLRADLKRLRR